MTGIDDPYEEPTDADLRVDTAELSVDAAVGQVLAFLARDGWIDPRRAPHVVG
jgi:sulfate adenylyltransferase